MSLDARRHVRLLRAGSYLVVELLKYVLRIAFKTLQHDNETSLQRAVNPGEGGKMLCIITAC